MPSESYTVPLIKAYDKPRTRRTNYALVALFSF